MKRPMANPPPQSNAPDTAVIPSPPLPLERVTAAPTREESRTRFRDLGELGRGGMADVRLARDNRLFRKVAVKSLRPDRATESAVARFVREARITAQLDHPNVPPVYSVEGAAGGATDLVMKHIVGHTLQDLIEETLAKSPAGVRGSGKLPDRLSLASRLGVFIKVCDAVHYAHEKGVIHRDLKPANIMVGDFGEAYVMDWGIARLVNDPPETLNDDDDNDDEDPAATFKTRVGQVIGTIMYMSPEQALGLPEIGPLSDQYALGVILQELATLRNGRERGDRRTGLQHAAQGKLTPLTAADKVPAGLAAIIRKATAPDPDGRYESVASLAEDVRHFLTGEELVALPDNSLRKIWRFLNRHETATAVFVLLGLLASASQVAWGLWQENLSMERGHARETAIAAMSASVANHAHHLDSTFQRLEHSLVFLASEAGLALDNVDAPVEKVYWQTDYMDPERAPSDLQLAPLYGIEVSPMWPVAKAAPRVDMEHATQLVGRLGSLRHRFRRVMLASRPHPTPVSEAEGSSLLLDTGVPIRWTYLGLDNGVMFSFPGKGTYPEDYDPRHRPWYGLGAAGVGPVWGNPYIDLHGQGAVLPCVTRIPSHDGHDWGVAGIEVTYGDLATDAFDRVGINGVKDSLILDEKARIVISAATPTAVHHPEGDPKLRLQPYRLDDVSQMIARAEAGGVIHTADRMVVVQRLDSLGWYYVEEIELTALFGE